MSSKWRLRTGAITAVLALLIVWRVIAGGGDTEAKRQSLYKAIEAGNFKDAYEGLRKLTLDPQDDPLKVGKDLTQAIYCLQRLGRVDEVDAFREAVIEAHKRNWRLLSTAARTFTDGEHFGFIVAGKFNRGHGRGQGRYVNAMKRDRVRGLQLLEQALPLAAKADDKEAVGEYYLQFARTLLTGGGAYEPWRLQYLSDLSQLPDYDEGYFGNYLSSRGAPVDEKGNPILYPIPKNFAKAGSDGERWRWLLSMAAEVNPALLNQTDMIFADFMRSQLGVQSMAQYGFGARVDTDADNKSGTYALHTLTDEESITRLAIGIRRLKVPDEFNWIKIYERIAGRGKSDIGAQARDKLAGEFEDRRQYVKASLAWKQGIEEYGPGQNNYRQQRLDQIVGNWGRFEPTNTQPSGTSAVVDFRYRNGNKVSFEARAIHVGKLLADVKAYLQSNPNKLDWNKTQIANIGYRLIEENEAQYAGDKVASWDLGLKPRPEHVDDRVTVNTPLTKAGAYLVTAQMAGGNTSRIVVWVADTAILKKQLEGQTYYYVADAANGAPIPKTNLEFFGWQQHFTPPNQFRIETRGFETTTDADGQAIVGQQQAPPNFQWLIIARKAGDKGADGRFAYLGYTNIWYGQRHDAEYNQTRVLVITDRPVYRPLNTVQFKAWVRHAQYDQADTSSFANQPFKVRILNPKNEKVLDKAVQADEYGGFASDLALPAGATLGVYHVQVLDVQDRHQGGGSFRVEEYKKPEYEVTVDGPKEPIRLGEQIKATIQAKYYFGAPVTGAKVKYKVTRTTHSASWYPAGTWDWFYGRGYWWFACDYAWYPGWNEWGMRRPVPVWWARNTPPPEVVMENEVEIGADGTVPVLIDTKPAQELHGNEDHSYAISAEVTDQSRRTIVGSGNVLVSRKPFQVNMWVDRGYFHVGDTVKASILAQTIDNKPVEGKGELKLYRITYNDKNEPVENAVQTWQLDTNVEGRANQQMEASKPGQFRVAYRLTDKQKHTIEGGYLFVVRGQGFTSGKYRFNDIELTSDKKEYKPGEKAKLLINTNQAGGTILLFARPANGIYLPPKMIRLEGKSIEETVDVAIRDMPNFFVEACTIHGGKVHTELRELVVPPEKRILNVEVVSSKTEYKPGEKAAVKIKLTDIHGNPFVGSTVVSVYDKSVEYISGGVNVPEIKEYFWKWRRHHSPGFESNLQRGSWQHLRRGEIGMGNLGLFGALVVEEMAAYRRDAKGDAGGLFGGNAYAAAPGAGFLARGAVEGGDRQLAAQGLAKNGEQLRERQGGPQGSGPDNAPTPTIRKNFADTAFWAPVLTTNAKGEAEVEFTFPDQTTGWKIRVWGMGHGTKVGEGTAEVVTKRDLIVRLQAPRFFVEKDEVVLSANVHNFLKQDKVVTATLELGGGTLASSTPLTQQAQIAKGGEKRFDWRVKVLAEGQAIIRMKASCDEDADAIEMTFPCFVHGMLKMESFTGVIRPNKDMGTVAFNIPAERRVNETKLEVRYSPSLAAALVDALPYLADYPYGCTEQTLNRFLPTVITQNVLLRMKLDLKEIQKHRTNLNSQEIGDDKQRIAKGWKRFDRNPVFDEAEVAAMVREGITRLAAMQLSDGGWGWFSGWGERSTPHTTAVVVHGLQVAKANRVQLQQNMLERGIEWLKSYQANEIFKLKNAPTKTNPYKEHADNMDAFVYMVLVDQNVPNDEMRDFLYRDRTHISVYAKAMFGLALEKQKHAEQLAMILQNIEQYLVQDDENQTAYLRLPVNNPWWYWYGDEVEANAYYLKLLARTSPKDEKASRLVKYLLNNRKHASYWNSTRDTSLCIEAMAEYLENSGEDRPDMTVEVWLDGKKHKEVHIDTSNLFTFDNKLVLVGDAVETGKHSLQIKRKGTGPVYFNAYVTNFTLEDFITKAGLEVKVNRKYYRLVRDDKEIKVPGSIGQPLGQRVERYKRIELSNLAGLKSGDLVEVELEIDSKNDYEYLIFEDMKPSGFEPVELRSGYTNTGLHAYTEYRDEKVCFFVRNLARGKHSVNYRMRAETPGQFSALPARGDAMYAPELQGNSDEIKLRVAD
jgi:alpha-2-macroglobulin